MFPSILLRVLTFYEVKFSLKGIMVINVGIQRIPRLKVLLLTT